MAGEADVTGEADVADKAYKAGEATELTGRLNFNPSLRKDVYFNNEI